MSKNANETLFALPTCPYCGEEQGCDSQDDHDGFSHEWIVHECQQCEKIFRVKRIYMYLNHPKEVSEAETVGTKPKWTRDPIPEEENGGHYFFAELHKGDWLVSLGDGWNTGGYKPNTPYWMRSQRIVFPSPPNGEGEEP